jgi:hypothetical protein
MTVLAAKPQDIILGVYWLTKAGAEGEGRGQVLPVAERRDPRARVRRDRPPRQDPRAAEPEKAKYAHFEGKPFETTVGRLLFNTVLPADYPYVNETITKKVLSRIVNDCIALRPRRRPGYREQGEALRLRVRDALRRHLVAIDDVSVPRASRNHRGARTKS